MQAEVAELAGTTGTAEFAHPAAVWSGPGEGPQDSALGAAVRARGVGAFGGTAGKCSGEPGRGQDRRKRGGTVMTHALVSARASTARFTNWRPTSLGQRLGG